MSTLTLSGSTAVGGPIGQPNIAYTPNLETYQQRVKSRLALKELPKTLPRGFPEELKSDLAWDGATVTDHYSWAYTLSASDLSEVQQALDHFQGITIP